MLAAAFFICLESDEDESDGYITSSSEELIILYAFYVCNWSEVLVMEPMLLLHTRCVFCSWSRHKEREVLLRGLFKMGIFDHVRSEDTDVVPTRYMRNKPSPQDAYLSCLPKSLSKRKSKADAASMQDLIIRNGEEHLLLLIV